MFSFDDFNKLYQILSLDMVDSDCGIKCGKFCCVGDGDTDYAFKYFLPGEELFSIHNGFHKSATLEDFGFVINYHSPLPNTCPCSNSRNYRPFCCRMFPFRPLINADECQVTDIYKTKNNKFSICWIENSLPEWKKCAIKAWNYVFEDKDNLVFYARYYFFLKKTEIPGVTFNSAMADIEFNEKILSLPKLGKKQLWQLCKQFFDYVE